MSHDEVFRRAYGYVPVVLRVMGPRPGSYFWEDLSHNVLWGHTLSVATILPTRFLRRTLSRTRSVHGGYQWPRRQVARTRQTSLQARQMEEGFNGLVASGRPSFGRLPVLTAAHVPCVHLDQHRLRAARRRHSWVPCRRMRLSP